MPRKDRELRLAYQREWYRKNRRRVIEKVRQRKYTHYGGTCENCGGRTMGDRPGGAARFCAKPECASAQRRAR